MAGPRKGEWPVYYQSSVALSVDRPRSGSSRSSQGQDFESALFEAMRHGLSLMGEDFAQVTLHNLDVRYSLGKSEILKKPERFVEALRDMFGEGAQIVENFIKQAICTEMGFNPSIFRRNSLSDCIRRVRLLAAEVLMTSRQTSF